MLLLAALNVKEGGLRGRVIDSGDYFGVPLHNDGTLIKTPKPSE